MSVDLRSQRVGLRFNSATYFNNRVCQRDVAEVLDLFECQMGHGKALREAFRDVVVRNKRHVVDRNKKLFETRVRVAQRC